MTRLKKELKKRHIIFETTDADIWKGPEYDMERKLVEITKDFIITVFYSGVLNPSLYLYNRHTFELIGEQLLYPEKSFFGNTRTWSSYYSQLYI